MPEAWEVRNCRQVGDAARLDLALALLSTDQSEEAAHITMAAVGSGEIVPSRWWRVAELVAAVERRGLPEAVELGEAYRAAIEG